jgi:hypothetical protein
MEKALEAEGMTLKHVIGPGTAHKYHPDSKIEINRIVDALAERGRDPLEYNRMNGSRSMHSISIGSGRDWMRRLWAIRRCR